MGNDDCSLSTASDSNGIKKQRSSDVIESTGWLVKDENWRVPKPGSLATAFDHRSLHCLSSRPLY